jgi:diguanylate cyclase (GGDEF)-like protein/putative nucleotidyltransferase with HDIG domain
MSIGSTGRQLLPPYGTTYILAVIAGGLLVLGFSFHEALLHPLGYQWYVLAGLTLVSGSATVSLPSVGISISVSETFIFFCALLFGPAAGTLLVALDCLVISFWVAKRRPEWYRPLFNIAAPCISFWIASHVLFAAAGIAPLFNRASPTNLTNLLLLPLSLSAAIYFSLNTGLILLPVAFQRRVSPFQVWKESSLLLSLNYFFGAAVALLLVVYTRDIDLTFVGVISPLLLVSYLTYRTTMGRLEDANAHVDQVNRLYLSTVETLAMAIDAKDQVTHGHIRRVQQFAVKLAQHLGVRDESLIKAIEAAALLHDMGKLAIPEYILNKPGRLTPAEFEKMKLHATVGADILSAIDFPYPVVPIVRHHHENWDGTGYPAGLKGTSIPIGARILAVVDCFDALTSDRPYRPKLTNEEAVRILIERRGSMYDPLIVDLFVKIHESITPDPSVNDHLSKRALDNIGTAGKVSALLPTNQVLDEIASSADEMLTLYELARSLTGQVSVTDSGDIIANHLRRLIPSALCVFFLNDTDSNDITARHAVGDGAVLVKGLRIAIGQRLSGWVAANRQTISNSDPALDLGEIARPKTLGLKSCISTPLIADNDQAVGVLTLYAKDSNAFNDDHRRIIEVVARQIGHTFRRAPEFDVGQRRDELTGLPNARQLHALVKSSIDDSASANFALLLIEFKDLRLVSLEHGRSAGDALLRHVVKIAQSSLRFADILFRHTDDEFVAFLNATDGDTARGLGRRIETSIACRPMSLTDGRALRIAVAVSSACCPADGRSLRELLTAARQISSAQLGAPDDLSIH